MRVLDVDTHVVESERVWDLLARSEEEFRPAILRKERGAAVNAHFAGPKAKEFWVIDNRLYGKHDIELISGAGRGEISAGAITLQDVPARLAEMDRQQVDVQVVFSSLFLNIRCDRANAELALTRAYNRWIAAACAQSGGRLRWIFVPSLKNIDATLRDMRQAATDGAVGVLFRGFEGDRYIDHPDFEPVFATAVDLNWPICVHIGHGSPAIESLAQRDGARFNRFISDSPNYFAFSTLLNSTLPAKYPALRFGFFESGCSWVPAAVQTAMHVRLPPSELMALVKEKLTAHNFWLTCELHEDLPHLMRYMGDDRLMLASDYGHPGDVADTIYFRQKLADRGDIDPALQERLVTDNGHGLFRI
ncbi:MAG: amidohydrolase family protein [Steroidobacteraceae bacterium]